MHATWELFDSWRGDEIVADQESGTFLADGTAGAFDLHDDFFDIAGQFNVPRSPQGRPVIFQAGDSDEGRDFAAETADAIFTRHGTLEAGKAFYADVKGRMARFGRTPDQLVVLPATSFVLAGSDADAQELAREIRLQQVSGQTAIKLLEQLWNRDLSAYDPDGPLPEIDPLVGDNTIAKGRASVRMYKDPLTTAAEWRQRAEAQKLSIRQLIVEVTGRQSFVGSAPTIAETMERFVKENASDGFILVPHITPGGLDEFADKVIPILQERGRFRADYEGDTFATTSDSASCARSTRSPGRVRDGRGLVVGTRPGADPVRVDRGSSPAQHHRSVASRRAVGLPALLVCRAPSQHRCRRGLAARRHRLGGVGHVDASDRLGRSATRPPHRCSRWSRSSGCSTWRIRAGSTSASADLVAGRPGLRAGSPAPPSPARLEPPRASPPTA